MCNVSWFRAFLSLISGAGLTPPDLSVHSSVPDPDDGSVSLSDSNDEEFSQHPSQSAIQESNMEVRKREIRLEGVAFEAMHAEPCCVLACAPERGSVEALLLQQPCRRETSGALRRNGTKA